VHAVRAGDIHAFGLSGLEDEMSELKPCPFCGREVTVDKWGDVHCDNNNQYIDEGEYCPNDIILKPKEWNTRPIEDDLTAELARLTAENERLSQILHDELSQLEIATDLGNKRWLALNDIYENGEKHNSNWCKRKAQEGLSIK
jgi:hypothetical protein